jgi:hypothetical protein
MSAFGAKPDPALIERYEAAGVGRVVFWLPSVERDEMERRLDELAGRLGEPLATS